MSKLKEATEKFPLTEIWNDSCSCRELQHSIETNGGVGATTNPVIVGNVLKKELPEWEDTIRDIIKNNPTYTEDDVSWRTIEALGTKASKLLLPIFKESHGQKGRISFQTNAKYYQNTDKMVEHAMQLASLVENSQIKAPASMAGIAAFEELTYQGVSINATVSFTCSQALAVAEAVERGLNRREAEGKDISWMHPVCTIMVGRVDDYLKNYLKGTDTCILPEALDMAGVAVVKNAYKIYMEKKYRTKLLVAAYRNLNHFEQFIGGDIVLTITADWQRKFEDCGIEIKNNMDTPVDSKLLDALKTLDEFNKAYEPDGLKPEEFQHYGAFRATINQFLGGYDSLVQLIRGYMVV
ncbi:MAG: transaldolase family protein [Lachnospiraceae bacterium]|nr:transaldolase family protein [Lachnospiraceae bacterium]